MMAAVGYDESGGKQTVYYLDPAEPRGGVPLQAVVYSEFVASKDRHTHWNDLAMLPNDPKG